MARVDGRPTMVCERYLGSAEDLAAAMAGRDAASLPERTRHRGFGDVAAVWGMLDRLDVVGLVGEVVGARRSDAGASVGQAQYGTARSDYRRGHGGRLRRARAACRLSPEGLAGYPQKMAVGSRSISVSRSSTRGDGAIRSYWWKHRLRSRQYSDHALLVLV